MYAITWMDKKYTKKDMLTKTKNDNYFEESWRFVLPGYNLRPIEMMGAIGSEQLKKLPDFIHERPKNAAYFRKYFMITLFFIYRKR